MSIRRKASVYRRHSLLIFEVFGVADATYNKTGTLASAAIDCHIAVANNLYPLVAGKPLFNRLNTLSCGEHILLVAVHPDGYYHTVEKQ